MWLEEECQERKGRRHLHSGFETRLVWSSKNGVVYLSAGQPAQRDSVHVVTVWCWAKARRLPQPIRPYCADNAVASGSA